jgi:ribonuclease P protein component
MTPALEIPGEFPGELSTRGRQWQPLAKRADFLRVGGSGLRYVTPAFILQAGPRTLHESHAQGAQIRVGFTASRKLGNAVARNRAKRRLRALVDRVIITEASPGVDYVLIGRPEALSRTFASMEQELRTALKRIAKNKTRRGPS